MNALTKLSEGGPDEAYQHKDAAIFDPQKDHALVHNLPFEVIAGDCQYKAYPGELQTF